MSNLKGNKPAPLARNQSFNGEVKTQTPGPPTSPLVQQVSRKYKRPDDTAGVPLHAKSASMSNLLVNNDDMASTTSVINGLRDFGGQRGHQDPSATPLGRQIIIDIQKDVQQFVVSTTQLKKTISEVATGKNDYLYVYSLLLTLQDHLIYIRFYV